MKKLLAILTIACILTGCGSSDNTEVAGKKVGTNVKIEDKDNTSKKEKEKNDNKKQDTSEKKEQAKVSDDKSKTEKETTGTTKKSDSQKSQSTTGKENNDKKQEKPDSGTTTETKPTKPSSPSKPSKPAETPPPVEPEPAPPTNQQAKADQVFAQINAYRVQNGKEPFVQSDFLKSRCDSHALAMANAEALWHSGTGAECITNYDDPFSAWVNSPPHNKMLLSNNSQAAVGIYHYNGYYYSVFQTRV